MADYAGAAGPAIAFLAGAGAGAYLISCLRKTKAGRLPGEDTFPAIFELTPFAMSLADIKDGRQREVNRAWLDLTGFERREEVIGKTSLELGLIPDAGPRERILDAFRRQGSVRNAELAMRNRKGEQRTVQVNLDKLEVGGRGMILTLMQDITSYRKAEEELQTLTRQRQLALNAASLGWWHYDPVTKIASWDDRYKEIFGVTGHSRPNEEILARLDPEDLPGVWAKVEAALDPADPKPYAAEYRVNLPGGQVKWVAAHGLALFEGEGRDRRAFSFVGTVEDITERKLARQSLERTAADLRAKNKELEDLMYVASHDLRAPLVNIQGFADNLARYFREIHAALGGVIPGEPGGGRLNGFLNSKIPEALNFVAGSGARMDRLIGAMLKVSRLGRLELRTESVDMDRLMSDLCDTMAFQIREAEAEIRAGKLPQCQGDREQLSQVFSNLLENALKYRAPGRKPVIEIKGTAGNGVAEYSVKDNGIGITEKEAEERIWTLFYRADPKGSVKGEGIGLTAAKRIVERHGGKISAAAVQGGGAEFTVRLRC